MAQQYIETQKTGMFFSDKASVLSKTGAVLQETSPVLPKSVSAQNDSGSRPLKSVSQKPVTISQEASSHISARTESADDSNGLNSNCQERNYCVAGWLVCISGPNEGFSYNLYHGSNIVNHCSVVYEGRRNRFYVVPKNEQMVCLNDMPLTDSAILQPGDHLTIGEDAFDFIAFCTGTRRWSDHLRLM